MASGSSASSIPSKPAACASPPSATRRPLADHRSLAGQIDAAVIAAPTRLHHAIALDLLDRGVHLLVEKPLAATAAEADDLVKAARRRGLVLQVGHVERFNPALGPLPDLADPKYMEALRAGPFTFRSTDIGVVLDLMIHDIDLVLSLVPSRVRKIEALGLSVLGGHEDVANARLEFECGCVAVLSASRVSYHSVRRMHVWTPRAFAAVDFAARTSTLVRPDGTLLDRRFDLDCFAPEGAEQKERLLQALLPCEERHFEPVDALLLEISDFLESIRHGSTAAPAVPPSPVPASRAATRSRWPNGSSPRSPPTRGTTSPTAWSGRWLPRVRASYRRRTGSSSATAPVARTAKPADHLESGQDSLSQLSCGPARRHFVEDLGGPEIPLRLGLRAEAVKLLRLLLWIDRTTGRCRATSVGLSNGGWEGASAAPSRETRA